MIELRHTEQVSNRYDEIYGTGGIPKDLDSFYLWVNDWAGLTPGQQVIDISSGRGYLVNHLQQSGSAALGIDISYEACQQAVPRTQGQVACANGEALPFADSSFDIALNIGSLEHFEDMPLGVREMARVLRPKGTALLLLPNTFGLMWTVLHAMKTGDLFDDGQPIQRYATRRQWERLLEGNGLQVKRVIGYEFMNPIPRTPRDFLGYLVDPRRFLKRFLIMPFLPTNLASVLIFICHPQK